ncbi:MAG: hypothetical protein DMD94_23635 [Candidatus Rokuibacteriota bacterium]|nr:MAG: hypothetical protein DMD94_23635 [Candidatus Rokubacteria bacterium]
MRWVPLEERVRTMPDSVREPFEILWQGITTLYYRWMVFKRLYRNARRTELLDAHAPGFFGLVGQIWVESIVLGLARVLDDRQGVVSIRLVVSRMETAGPNEIVEDLRRRRDQLERLSKETVEAHRNKRIAHLDGEYHPRGGKRDLPPLKVESLDRLFQGITELMNVVGVGVGHGTTIYDAATAESGEDSLIFALRKADRFDEIFPWPGQWDELAKGRFADLDRPQQSDPAP